MATTLVTDSDHRGAEGVRTSCLSELTRGRSHFVPYLHLSFPACNLEVILGFDGSRDQNVFVSQKGLESKVDTILNRISQMQRISCSGNQLPTVRVSVVANTPSGPVEAFDFAEYQPELFEKFRNMRSQHPYILTADTLKLYQNKFRQSSSPDSVKVSSPGLGAPCAALKAPHTSGNQS